MPRTASTAMFALLLPASLAAEVPVCPEQSRGCAQAVAGGRVDVPVVLLQQELLVSHRAVEPAARLQQDLQASAAAVGGTLEVEMGSSWLEFAHSTVTASPTGVSKNGAGNLSAFIQNVILNTVIILVLVAVFMGLRVRYPITYSNNVLKGIAPSKPDVTNYWSWWNASFGPTLEERIESIGLDNAMLIEYTNMTIKLFGIISLPMMLILGPLNLIFGGFRAKTDPMSWLSAGNVDLGCWLWWIYPIFVWGVTIFVCRTIWKAQEKFVPLRWAWLERLPPVRANTILVQAIPEEQQSDEALRKFFDELFPGGRVKSAYVVKDTATLLSLMKQRDNAKDGLAKAEHAKAKDPAETPMVRPTCCGSKVEAIPYYTELLEELEPQIKETRRQILESSVEVGEAAGNCAFGFVSFQRRSDAEFALNLQYISKDMEEFLLDTPPPAIDVDWKALQQDPNAETGRALLGYAAVVGLILVYLPIVIAITNLATSVNLGPLQPIWSSVAPSLGLTIMVSFLPTFIILIFKLFFTQFSAQWAQHKLQCWYFWFQVLFVILATAVGASVPAFVSTVVKNPLGLLPLLATTLPFATHFYWNFLVLQWTDFSKDILRYVPLAKFKFWSAIYDEEEALKKAEPEDQDFYGLGSRSARWSVNVGIGLIFGTLSPPINLVALLTQCVVRMIFGYLIPYAETKKPDLGGVFWVRKLREMYYLMFIYSILMTAVLLKRASSIAPGIIVAPTILYIFFSKRRFETAFPWEKLPFHELMTKSIDDGEMKNHLPTLEYTQPELKEE